MQYIIALIFIQCAIPVFDGLLPEPHNGAILKLLFVMAHWHGLAKLRMHNDLTLDVMDVVTVSLGDKLRAFSQDTCAAFDTKELPREADARFLPVTKQSTSKGSEPVHDANADASSQVHQAPPNVAAALSAIREQPSFVQTGEPSHVPPGLRSYITYKFHSFGDHVSPIRPYGTMDSYSTEPVRNLFNLP
jgi:hypothetical protein